MFAGDNVQESIRETAQQFVLASTILLPSTSCSAFRARSVSNLGAARHRRFPSATYVSPLTFDCYSPQSTLSSLQALCSRNYAGDKCCMLCIRCTLLFLSLPANQCSFRLSDVYDLLDATFLKYSFEDRDYNGVYCLGHYVCRNNGLGLYTNYKWEDNCYWFVPAPRLLDK